MELAYMLLGVLTLMVIGTRAHPADKVSDEVRRQKRTVVVHKESRLWENAEVPYTFETGTSADMRARIEDAMQQISEASCITFRDVEFVPLWMFDYPHERKLHISTTDPNLCYAQVGFSGFYGNQPVELGANCATDERIPVMVVMMSIGFYQEHRRPDRDSYITVQEDQIDGWPREVFNVLWEGVISYLNYDYDMSSVMHPPGTFLRKDLSSLSMVPSFELTRRSDGLDNLGGRIRPIDQALSHRDKAVLNDMYQCASSCTFKNCQYGGYQNQNCDCVCPHGLTGTLCDELDLSDTTNNNCGDVYTSGGGTIKSTGYPSPYAFDTHCRWLIRSTHPSDTICVRVDDMNFHGPDDYDQLWVYIYGPGVDLYSLSYNDLASYKGKWYRSQVNAVTIEFKSEACDSNVRSCGTRTDKGFQVSYSFGCDGIPDEEIEESKNSTAAALSCKQDVCVQEGHCPEVVDLSKCRCLAEDGGHRCTSDDNLQLYVVYYHLTEPYTADMADESTVTYTNMHQRVCKWTYDGFQNSQHKAAFVPCHTVYFSEHPQGTTVRYLVGFNTTMIQDILQEEGATAQFSVEDAERSIANLFLIGDPVLEVQDYNECDSSEAHTCDKEAECVNEDGGYSCQCRSGYEDESPEDNYPGRMCKDKDAFDWKWVVIVLAIILLLCLILCPIICWYMAHRRRQHKKKYSENTTRYTGNSGSLPSFNRWGAMRY